MEPSPRDSKCDGTFALRLWVFMNFQKMSLLSFLSTDPNKRKRVAQLQSEGSGLNVSKKEKQHIAVKKLTGQAVLSDFPLPAQSPVILQKLTTVSLQADNIISEFLLLP